MQEIERNKLYTLGEAAYFLDMAVITLRNKIKQKKIGYIFDGVYKIPGYDILEYLDKYHVKAGRIE